MAAEKIVYYVDGSKASIRTLMIDQIMVERDGWGGDKLEAHAVEVATRAIHHALVRSGQVFDKYDVWITTVEDVEIPDDEGKVVTDPPAQASDTAQPSP